MTKLSEEAKKIITEIHPGLIATASKDGKPNVSPRGSFRVLDDKHVIFADQGRLHSIANLRENPQLSAIVFDPATRRGCRIWGKAEILDSGDLFDTVTAAQTAAGRRVPKHVVKVAVEEVVTF